MMNPTRPRPTTSTTDQLVLEQMPLVRAIVRQFARRVPTWVDRQELESAGMLGLAEAAGRWDAERGVPFAAFAATRVRGAILDELRRLDTLPRLRRRAVRRLADEGRRLSALLGREPGDDELAAALDMTTEEVTALRADAAAGAASCELDHERDLDVAAEPADHRIEREQKRDQIRAAIAVLPERQREVVGLYYEEGLTLKQIGARLGVTESRVCQLRTVAERRLRTLIEHGPRTAPVRRRPAA